MTPTELYYWFFIIEGISLGIPLAVIVIHDTYALIKGKEGWFKIYYEVPLIEPSSYYRNLMELENAITDET